MAVAETTSARIHWLQLYLGLALVSTLTIAAAVEDRKRVEQALGESELRYRFVIDHARDMIALLSMEGTYLFISEACRQRLGQPPEEAVGRPALALIHPDDLEQVRATLTTLAKEGDTATLVYRIRHTNGTYRWYETILQLVRAPYPGTPCAVLAISRDISERRALEEQLLQAQKMETIGRLAAGVAHDFNNLLAVIQGYAELAEEEVPAESPVAQHLQTITTTTERAADIIQQLLAFARQQAILPKVIIPNDLIRASEPVLRRLLPENVLFQTRMQPDLWAVRIDPGQFHQIILNLIVNAGDAMPEGGTLTLTTENSVLDAEATRHQLDLKPGDYVQLTVQDTGFGMNAEVRERIFEPFFTTKAQGKGTGLGLATCYGIVRQNGGCITVDSAPDEGATFRIFLPHAIGKVDAVSGTAAPSPQGTEAVAASSASPAVDADTRASVPPSGTP